MRGHQTTAYTPEIFEAMRRHLADNVPVSVLCKELGIQPTVFYRWKRVFKAHLAETAKMVAVWQKEDAEN
jgi:hypothetical protein